MDNKEYTNGGTFSIRRFTTLLKSDFIINGGSYMKLAFAAVGCFIAVAILVSISQISDINNIIRLNPDLSPEDLECILRGKRSLGGGLILFFGLAIMSLGLTVLGSLTFSNMSDKRHRIATLMLPASIMEKFTLRMLVYFIGGIVVLLAGFFIGILVGQLSFGGGIALSQMIDETFKEPEIPYLYAISGLWLLVGNAIYTLGSAIWPKLSWIKTWIVLTVIQWIFGIMLISGLFANYNIEFIISYLDNAMLIWGIISFEICVIGLCWVLAWWRFRNTQIIQAFMKK